MTADEDRDTRELVEAEFSNGRHLHQNYLKKRRENPRKAGEHLWGAVNNLLSALCRLETGTGLGKHERVRAFAHDWIATDERISKRVFEAAEILHRNFYYDFLDGGEWQELADRAHALYDALETDVSDRLYEDAATSA